MDVKGRSIDYIVIERFYRILKYENIYLLSYTNIKEAREGMGVILPFSNFSKNKG